MTRNCAKKVRKESLGEKLCFRSSLPYTLQSLFSLPLVLFLTVKYENIMFENDGPNAEIKVIDFGLSKKFAPGTDPEMNEGVGTVYTMAPQVLQGVYTSQADLWSAGVILYMLLSAHRPFHHQRRKVMIDRIMRVDYTLDKVYWEPISTEAKDLVSHLLVLDPNERLNGTEALKHPWLSKEYALSDRKPDPTVIKAVDASLVVYKDTSRLKKIALNVRN
jgi:calcium-dependent protein kinase